MKKVRIFLFCFCLSFISFSEASNLPLIPNAFLIIPEGSLVKVEWVVIPQSRENLPKLNSAKLVVNSKGEPLIIYERKVIFNPLAEYVMIIDEPVKDLVCLENSVLLISDGSKIGFITFDQSKKTLPTGRFIPIANLPIGEVKIFGGSDTVYAVKWNQKAGQSEVFLFDRAKRVFRRLLTVSQRIEAVTGDGQRIFFASGKTIGEFVNGKISILYEHPSQTIEEIFFNEKVGLVYRTSKGVGFVKDGSALEFLQAEAISIFLRGTSLFVLFDSISGVLELKNIDDLKNYSFKIKKLTDIKESL